MQAALRRCTASLPQLSRCAPSTTRLARTSSAAPQAVLQSLRSTGPVPTGLRALSTTSRWREAAAAAAAPAEGAPPAPITEFSELATQGIVHPNVIRTITQTMGLSKMTDVQTATINEALAGVDLIGQAKTGTGKTLAFLMPIFQRIIALDPSLASRSYGRTSASDIRAVIISPTRELAEQIATEARTVSRGTGVIVQAAVGGTQKGQMLQRTRREGCHILVGTPGRLADLLSDPRSGIDAPKLNMFVLDEADRLLDQGFWPDIQNIRRMLPEPRENNVQTLMFSATVPREVVSAVRETLKPGFRFIKCVRDDEEPTHARVPQNLVRVASMQNWLPAIYELCLNELEKRTPEAVREGALPFKAIVYFNSTAMVELASDVFQSLRHKAGSPLNTSIFHMHSKLTQAQRSRASDAFRAAKSGILLSSDVTARGMDFPNVTHVMQVGVPQNAESYVHRIGRTARAGKEGTGYIFISPLDERVTRSRLQGLPLRPTSDLQAATVDMTQPGDMPQRVVSILQDLNEAHRSVDRTAFSNAYRSLLGTHQYVDDKQMLIDSMNDLAKYGWGLETPPGISHSLVQKLGLGRVRGLNFDHDGDHRRGGSGFGGSRFGGDRFGGDPFGSRNSFDRNPFERSGGGGGDRRGGDRGDPFATGGSNRGSRHRW